MFKTNQVAAESSVARKESASAGSIIVQSGRSLPAWSSKRRSAASVSTELATPVSNKDGGKQDREVVSKGKVT